MGNHVRAWKSMVDQFLCHGVHAYGSIGSMLCAYVYDGTVTDVLAILVIVLSALCGCLLMSRS
jgi:hypothetical protein